MIILAVSLSCGRKKDLKFLMSHLFITGTVDTSQVQNAWGPVFVLATNTDNMDLIDLFPEETVLTFTTVGPDGSFAINCGDAEIIPGMPVHFVAFVDHDYIGGIPQPTVGDWLGIYINSSDMFA